MNPSARSHRTLPRLAFRPNALAAALLTALGLPALTLAQTVPGQVAGASAVDAPGIPVGANLQFTGGLSQVGIGIDRDSHLHAQGSHVFGEDELSAWIAQGWLSGNAGGIRLDRNWIPERDGQADTGALVRKLFGALDRNRDGDGKLTLGAGLENEHGFGSISVSRGLTGERAIGSPAVSTSTATLAGTDNGRPYVDTITTTTTTRYFQQAYDYGLGLRAGTWFRDAQLRASIGLDHEWGSFSSRQNTFSVGLEKYFVGSPHSIGLFLEHYDKSGRFESGNQGTRALLVYRYSFGGNAHAEASGWREARRLRRVEVPASASEDVLRQSAPPVTQATRKEVRIVKKTASMTSDAFFEFGKGELTPLARGELDRVAEVLRTTERAGNIRIAGHTCDIGSEVYNLRLSQRRAGAVKEYLVRAGLPVDALVTEGLGESSPKFPNTPATRAKNRRVDIEFVQYRDHQEEVEVPVEVATPVATTTPAVTWREEFIDQEPAWVRRALRNTVSHKQSVDTYRGAEVTSSSSSSRAWQNRVPLAQDDTLAVRQDEAATIDVLANDSDPDGNALTLVAVGPAAHGMATMAGNSVRYTPAAGYVGSDTFTYSVEDGAGGRATASIHVTVERGNAPPVAASDMFLVSYPGDWPLDVLANDTDPDGDRLTIVSFTQPQPSSVGSVTQQGNRLFFHIQALFGSATFTYTISDGKGGTATGTVTLIDP